MFSRFALCETRLSVRFRGIVHRPSVPYTRGDHAPAILPRPVKIAPSGSSCRSAARPEAVYVHHAARAVHAAPGKKYYRVAIRRFQTAAHPNISQTSIFIANQARAAGKIAHPGSHCRGSVLAYSGNRLSHNSIFVPQKIKRSYARNRHGRVLVLNEGTFSRESTHNLRYPLHLLVVREPARLRTMYM